MNRIQPINPVRYVDNTQFNRNTANNVKRQRPIDEKQQIVVRIRHQEESNTQTTYNSNGEKQQVPNIVSTFEGVA